MIFAISPAERHLPSANASGMPVERGSRVAIPLTDSVVVGAAAAASFLTGLGGSGHCALMCGPLACVGLPGDARARRRAALGWQAARLVAYAALGASLGLVGHAGLSLARTPVARALPWILVAGLVLSAAEVGRRLPALPGLGRIPAGLARRGARLSPASRAALRGAATPFLPCGLLYGALVVAIGTGSAAAGALVMFAFGLGALPALALVQLGAPRLAAHPAVGRAVRRAVPLLAAAVVAWRALSARGAGPPHCH
jgi:sulfite exporter TauE/SafE